MISGVHTLDSSRVIMSVPLYSVTFHAKSWSAHVCIKNIAHQIGKIMKGILSEGSWSIWIIHCPTSAEFQMSLISNFMPRALGKHPRDKVAWFLQPNIMSNIKLIFKAWNRINKSEFFHFDTVVVVVLSIFNRMFVLIVSWRSRGGTRATNPDSQFCNKWKSHWGK